VKYTRSIRNPALAFFIIISLPTVSREGLDASLCIVVAQVVGIIDADPNAILRHCHIFIIQVDPDKPTLEILCDHAGCASASKWV
jgi:hypothetical protein